MAKTRTRTVKPRPHAQQLWLASLGALAEAGEQGSRVFDQLVSLGERMEQRARGRMQARLSAAENQLAAARAAALEAWISLGKGVQARITALLHRFQIPTARDVHELNRRVEALQAAVEALASENSSRGAKPRRTAARKTAERRATPRKPPPRKRSGSRKAG